MVRREKRRWRIMVVDDELADNAAITAFGYTRIREWAGDGLPGWLLGLDDVRLRSESSKSPEVPLLIECGRFADAWRVIPEVADSLEIALFDVRLDEGLLERQGAGIQTPFDDELIASVKPIMSEIAKEGLGPVESDVATFLGRGGYYLWGLLTRSAARMPSGLPRPTAYLVTGDKNVPIDAAPFLFAGVLPLLSKGSVIGEFLPCIDRRRREWLESGVSVVCARDVCARMEDALARSTNSEQALPECDALARTDIGEGWTFGAFFLPEIYRVLAAPDRWPLAERREAILGIRTWLESQNYAIALARFLDDIRYSNFTVLAHRHGKRLSGLQTEEFYDLSIAEANDRNLLRQAITDLDAKVAASTFASGVPEIRVALQRFLRRQSTIDQLCDRAQALNRAMRMRPWDVVEKLLEVKKWAVDTYKLDASVLVGGRDVRSRNKDEVKDLLRLHEIGKGQVITALPENLLVDTLRAMIAECCIYGWSKPPDGQRLMLKMDRSTDHAHVWVLELCQIGGALFDAGELSQRWMLGDSGGLSKALRKLKNWTDVTVCSGDLARNPWAAAPEHSSEYVNGTTYKMTLGWWLVEI
jgi:hypothetical protein